MENVACFQCEHCGYSTNIKQTFHRHLQRKTPCNLEVANVHIKPIDDRNIKELSEDNLRFPCKYKCGAYFKHQSGKYRHQSTCKYKHLVEFDKVEMCKRMIKLEEEIVSLKNTINVAPNVTNKEDHQANRNIRVNNKDEITKVQDKICDSVQSSSVTTFIYR